MLEYMLSLNRIRLKAQEPEIDQHKLCIRTTTKNRRKYSNFCVVLVLLLGISFHFECVLCPYISMCAQVYVVIDVFFDNVHAEIDGNQCKTYTYRPHKFG